MLFKCRTEIEFIWQHILSGNIFVEWPDDFIFRQSRFDFNTNQIPDDVLAQSISLPVFMEFWSDNNSL